MSRRGIDVLKPKKASETEREPDKEEGQEGTKAELVGFSKKAKLNVARLLSTLDWNANGTCLHVCLSYHKAWPKTKAALALEKSALVEWLGRKWCGIWKLEYQGERFLKYGVWVPHWHVLLWIGNAVPLEVEQAIREWWADFATNKSYHGVEVRVGDEARAAWYLALHTGKDEQAPSFKVGRWWGYIRRDRVLSAQQLGDLGEVSECEAVWLQRIARRFRRVRGHGRRTVQGFTLFLTATAASRLLSWLRTSSGLPEAQEARATAKASRCTFMSIPASGGPAWESRKPKRWATEDF